MRYSNTTKNFYPDDIDYPVFPDDIIEVAQADFDAAMARQSGETIDMVNDKIVIIPKFAASLDEIKQLKITEITDAFTTALEAGFVTASGIKMNATLFDVQLLKSAYDLMLLLEQPVLPILIDYNNAVHVDMPVNEVIAIIIEVGVNYQSLFAKKQTLRGLALAAANQTELNLITW